MILIFAEFYGGTGQMEEEILEDHGLLYRGLNFAIIVPVATFVIIWTFSLPSDLWKLWLGSGIAGPLSFTFADCPASFNPFDSNCFAKATADYYVVFVMLPVVLAIAALRYGGSILTPSAAIFWALSGIVTIMAAWV